MNTKKGIYSSEEIKEKSPLDKFASLIREIKPDIVSMENVPGLMTNKKSESFKHFLQTLSDC
jgi:C-5 cytosine-specific DNA methylase